MIPGVNRENYQGFCKYSKKETLIFYQISVSSQVLFGLNKRINKKEFK
jgi:hypothetical protein